MKKLPIPITDFSNWLSSRVLNAFSQPGLIFLKNIASAADGYGKALYLVGGTIRDLLLGKPINDLDFVLEGDAISWGEYLIHQYGGKIVSHSRFGTAVWSPDLKMLVATHIPVQEQSIFQKIDLITARSEMYPSPAALPSVRPGLITDDVRRRDFTINTLALRIDDGHFGELLDLAGGVNDLRKGQIKVLHNNSFIDDPTRLFRAVRLAERYSFVLSPETAMLIPSAIPLIDLLSSQRVRHELEMVFDESSSPQIMSKLTDYGVIRLIHTSLGWDDDVASRFITGISENDNKRFMSRRTASWVLWLMDRSDSELLDIHQRLNFPSQLMRVVRGSAYLFANKDRFLHRKASEITRELDVLPLRAVYAVLLSNPVSEIRKILENYLLKWRLVRPSITGKYLIAKGIPQGPDYRAILGLVRDALLDEAINSLDQEREFVDHYLETGSQ